MITLDFTGQTAIVTGAGRGLAKEVALLLAKGGANVIAADIVKENVEQAEKDIKEYGVKGFGRVVDVTKEEQMKDLVDFAVKETGRLDIFVNGAGVAYRVPIFEATTEQIDHLINVNIKGVDYGCKYAGLAMKKAGTHGRIINIASVAGREGVPSLPHYAMTKGAVINLTQSYALSLAEYGITVNSINPGIIRTPMWESFLDGMVDDPADKDETFKNVIENGIPMKKAQENIDIAYATVFLASPQARYITGQGLNICGGMYLD